MHCHSYAAECVLCPQDSTCAVLAAGPTLDIRSVRLSTSPSDTYGTPVAFKQGGPTTIVVTLGNVTVKAGTNVRALRNAAHQIDALWLG